jgi:hypothetical protein
MNSIVLFLYLEKCNSTRRRGALTARNQHVSDNTIELPCEIAILPIDLPDLLPSWRLVPVKIVYDPCIGSAESSSDHSLPYPA